MADKWIQIDAPASTPVTLAQFKANSRIDEGAEDSRLQEILDAATERVEALIGQAFAGQQYRAELEGFPSSGDRVIVLPIQIESVDTFTYTNAAGTSGIAFSDYLIDTRTPGRSRIHLGEDQDDWPDGNEPRITVTAATPKAAIQAILMLAGHWHEHREDAQDVATHPVPHGVMDLIRQVRSEGLVIA
jgi:hypothetical protein